MNDVEGTFRLLVRAAADEPAASTLLIGGETWKLGPWRELPGEDEALEYTCVSYAWGHASVPHAMDPGRQMSARAWRATETVVAAFSPAALWVDAFCVPAPGPARTACIRRLGSVYAGAARVVAVLSPAWAPALDRLAQGGHDLPDADPLDGDDWARRVWTYQEILNSRDMQFIAEGGRTPLSAMQLLSGLGHFMVERQRELGIDAFALRQRHPRLDALQDLLAEWQIGSYLERPAFQLLSGMGTRESLQADDRYDAMIGIVEPSPADRTGNGQPVPAIEALLQACDAKGDFSYVYAVAPRSTEAGRSWRPAPPGPMRAPMMWHCYGSGQAGALSATHLRLDGVALRRQGTIGEEGQAFIAGWLGIERTSFDAREAAQAACRRLRDAEFDGAPQPIECEDGLLFTQSAHTDLSALVVVTPLNLEWPHGSPALLLERQATGDLLFRDAGVFIGPKAAMGASIDIA